MCVGRLNVRRTASIILLLIVAAFAFQASDLTRAVYARFDLSMHCPIVGQRVWGGSDRNAVDTTACAEQPAVLDGCCPSQPPPNQKQPTPDSEDGSCHTCKLLAATSTFVSLSSPSIHAAALLALRSDQVSFLGVPVSDANPSVHGRAPPGGVTFL